MQEGGHVGDPHLFDELALLPVFGHHEPGRGVEPQGAGGLGRDEAVLDGHRHGADRAVSAHRQAARGLDEEDADVAIRRASADTGSSRTSCRVRAARTSGRCGSSRTPPENARASPASWRRRVAGRRRRPGAPDSRRYGRRCTGRCGGTYGCSPLRRPWPGQGGGSGTRARWSRPACAARRPAAGEACAHARSSGSPAPRQA